LAPEEGEIAIEDLIANEGVIITITHAGLIKRTNVSSYRAQRRGGKGVIGMATREPPPPRRARPEDFIEHLFTASTHDYLMFFTNTGRAYVERVHEVPDMGRAAKGRSIANLLELKADEKIAALIRIVSKTGPNKEDITWTQPEFRFLRHPQGTVKKTSPGRIRQRPQRRHHRHRHRTGDTLIDVKLTGGNDEVVLITSEGQSIRFSEAVRVMGRPPAACAASAWKSPTPSWPWPWWCPTRPCWWRAKTASASAPIFRIPPPIPRRQGHHHHENDRPHRQSRRRAHGQGRRRNHAHHRGRPDGAHARERHPRSRPQHARRQS
jgi:hypothetical protein